MNFFYDFEFLEHKVTTGGFWNRRSVHAVEPIQIGIVCETDGFNAYYNDFDLHAVWNHNWLRENVLKPIYNKEIGSFVQQFVHFDFKWFKRFIDEHGHGRKEIAMCIEEFVYTRTGVEEINMYGYYSDYDHVCLSNTFGTMMELPERFPMFTIDLKQMLNQVAYDLPLYRTGIVTKNTLAKDRLELIGTNPKFPQQTDEHNALSDAKWNMELYNFLTNLKHGSK